MDVRGGVKVEEGCLLGGRLVGETGRRVNPCGGYVSGVFTPELITE